MQEEVNTENADSVENTASEVTEETPEVESATRNMSEDDFINSRVNRVKAESSEKEATPTEETPEEEPKKEEPKAVVPSQVDLDDMSEAELEELSKKLGSRAVARFGELTAKRKAAEEKAKMLEAQIKKQSAPKPVSFDDISNNPYKDITDIKLLRDKVKEVNEIVEWSEDVLFESDNHSASDIVANLEGKEVTKSEVREILKNARKSQKKHIPQQAQYLKSIADGKNMAQSFGQRVRKEISWVSDPKNETNKKYQSMLRDPRLLKTLESATPDIKAQMPYLLAHAANSMYGERTIVTDTKDPVKPSKSINPPKAVTNNAAKTEKTTNRKTKSIQNNQKSFRSTGGIDDFIKLRTAQMSR